MPELKHEFGVEIADVNFVNPEAKPKESDLVESAPAMPVLSDSCAATVQHCQDKEFLTQNPISWDQSLTLIKSVHICSLSNHGNMAAVDSENLQVYHR